jgi:hypothetical protein
MLRVGNSFINFQHVRKVTHEYDPDDGTRVCVFYHSEKSGAYDVFVGKDADRILAFLAEVEEVEE